jgi:hypothetical protein
VPAVGPAGAPRNGGARVTEITDGLDLSGRLAGLRGLVRRERPDPGAQSSLADRDAHRFQAILARGEPIGVGASPHRGELRDACPRDPSGGAWPRLPAGGDQHGRGPWRRRRQQRRGKRRMCARHHVQRRLPAAAQPPPTVTPAWGVNLHNAEVGAFFAPEAGNAYYHAIAYGPTPAVGSPGCHAGVLRDAAVRALRASHDRTPARARVQRPADRRAAQGVASRRRSLGTPAVPHHKGDRPVTLNVKARASWFTLSRMTPLDPAGLGRTLDAPMVRVDGREVSPTGAGRGSSRRPGRSSASASGAPSAPARRPSSHSTRAGHASSTWGPEVVTL